MTEKQSAKNATPTFKTACGKSAPVMELAKIQVPCMLKSFNTNDLGNNRRRMLRWQG
jgi:hypothetical protein